MAISVPQLSAYMGAGLNILITGEPGTGKTAMLKEAASKNSMRMQYYSASTLDPVIDLIGIPVPDTANKRMEFYRPAGIETAEVVFFDEISRASLQTMNAILEVTQFRSLNGEPLPNLKCVVAAMNPADAAQGTDELPAALADRFDVYLEAAVKADYSYLKRKYGESYARAGVSIFDDYQRSYNNAKRSKKNTIGYLSPRRLDKLMEIYKAFPKAETVRAVLPSDVVVSAPQVAQLLSAGLNPATVKAAPKADTVQKKAGPSVNLSSLARDQLNLNVSAMRSSANRKAFNAAYEWAVASDPKTAEALREKLCVALSYSVGPATMKTHWSRPLADFSMQQRSRLSRGWTASKTRQLYSLMGW